MQFRVKESIVHVLQDLGIVCSAQIDNQSSR